MESLNATLLAEFLISEVNKGRADYFATQLSLKLSCLILVCCATLLYVKKRFANHKSFEVPSPYFMPIFGGVLDGLLHVNDIFGFMTSFLKYGKIVKNRFLFTDYYFLMDPEFIQKALSSTNPDHLNKPGLAYNMPSSYKVQNGLIFSEYPVWSHHRKLYSGLFSYQGIKAQLGKFNSHTKRFITQLMDLPSDQLRNANVDKLLHNLALKIILHIVFGAELASNEEQNELHSRLIRLKYIISQRVLRPWRLLPPIWWLHPHRNEFESLEAYGKEFFTKLLQRLEERRHCDSRGENKTSEKVIKSLFEEFVDSGLTVEDIQQECVTTIYAGHETAISSTTILLLQLALNPEIQGNCRKEVDDMFERKKSEENFTSSLETELSMKDLNSLEYLERCVKENLRLTPIIPVFLRRVDAPLKLQEGLVIEKGSCTAFSPWVTHRNPDIFPDPEKFNPDRFLPEECKKRHPSAFIPFSVGPRNCIGWKLAPQTIKLITAFILRHFEVRTTDRWEDVEFLFDITVTTKKSVNLIFNKRHNVS